MWTYSGDPAASARDLVRHLVGDTDTTDQQVTDEEIAWAVGAYATTYLAASATARAIAARYARKADKSVGDLSLSYSQLQRHYAELAADLDAKGNVSAGMPYAGGIGIADRDAQEADDDRVQPAFKIGVHDNPDEDLGAEDELS